MAKSVTGRLISGFVLSLPVMLLAQTQPAQRPVFEVASIKPTDVNDN